MPANQLDWVNEQPCESVYFDFCLHTGDFETMKLSTKFLFVVALAFAGFTSAQANAGLIGNTITGSYYFPDAATVYGGFSYSVNPFVVGAGVESVLTIDGFATTDVDFSDAALVLTPTADVGYNGSSFNGPKFFITSGDPFSSVSSVVTSGGQTVTAEIVSGVLEVNWSGQAFAPGDTITVNFSGLTSVPEPTSAALFGGALVGLALWRRRKAV